MSFFAWLYFWKYYFKEESNEKDLKLVEVRANLVPSNFLLYIIFILISFLYKLNIDGRLLGGIEIFLVICSIVQFVFQIKVTFKPWKRVNGITSFRKDFKESVSEVVTATSILAGSLIYSVADDIIKELRNIINEFYGDYTKSSTYRSSTYNNHKHQKDSNKDYNYSKDIQNNTKELKRILTKYNLSEESGLSEVKKQFRTLAKKYHPDMPSGDEKLFIELRKDLEYLVQYFERNAHAKS